MKVVKLKTNFNNNTPQIFPYNYSSTGEDQF